MGFDVLWLVAAFGGGVFGASVGALPAFILSGFAAIVGPAVALATGNAAFTVDIAFGPMLGPHPRSPAASQLPRTLPRSASLPAAAKTL